jgi:hypothetical protein
MSTQDVERSTARQAASTTAPGHGLRDLWPGALGLGVAVLLLAIGAADRNTLAIGVTAAASCYLAAAALGRPWVAWAAIPGASVVVVASRVVELPWWAGLGVTALALVVVGLSRGATRPTLTQAVALAAFGGLAVVALAIDPLAGLVLAGLTLASHALWDAVHHRRGTVVPRSLAEACMLFDVVLGLGCIALAVLG